jgi:four helix bundle protein
MLKNWNWELGTRNWKLVVVGTTDWRAFCNSKGMFKKLINIEVFIISENISNIIWNIVKKWDYFDRDTIGKQLVRAVDSISANIAESHGRYHFKDKQKFGYYARGSLEETKSWLRKCYQRKLLSENQMKDICFEINKIGPKLNSLINTFKYPQND